MGNFTEADIKNKYILSAIKDEVNTTTIKKITQAKLRTTIIPLPPLAEQKCIVAKVDELMSLYDQFEAHITHIQTINTHLMGSLIHSMTEAA